MILVGSLVGYVVIIGTIVIVLVVLVSLKTLLYNLHYSTNNRFIYVSILFGQKNIYVVICITINNTCTPYVIEFTHILLFCILLVFYFPFLSSNPITVYFVFGLVRDMLKIIIITKNCIKKTITNPYKLFCAFFKTKPFVYADLHGFIVINSIIEIPY